MQKQAPSLVRLATMVTFALSCIGLLLFLWLSFGGAVPLKPKGYRVEVPFREAVQLAEQADVRISGVPVGNVVGLERVGDRTVAELQIDAKYAPLPADTQAQLRAKTLLGETYVELSPGSKGARKLPEGGRLPAGQVKGTVELDEILRTFDAPTRRSLQTWFQGWSKSVDGRAGSINATLGNLPGLATEGNDVTGTLDSQGRAVTRLVRDAGTIFATVGDQDNAAQQLITSGNQLFTATAARDRELAATIRALPPFLDGLRTALPALATTSRQLEPVLSDLRPAVRSLPATLDGAKAFAPRFTAVSQRLAPVLPVAEKGLPAVRRTVRALSPLTRQLTPLGLELEPIVQFLSERKVDVTNSWPKVAAATNAVAKSGNGKDVHYLRLVAPFSNETLAASDQRQATNRVNPYLEAGGISKIATNGLESFTCAQASRQGGLPPIGEAMPCLQQKPMTFQGRSSSYPQVRAAQP